MSLEKARENRARIRTRAFEDAMLYVQTGDDTRVRPLHSGKSTAEHPVYLPILPRLGEMPDVEKEPSVPTVKDEPVATGKNAGMKYVTREAEKDGKKFYHTVLYDNRGNKVREHLSMTPEEGQKWGSKTARTQPAAPPTRPVRIARGGADGYDYVIERSLKDGQAFFVSTVRDPEGNIVDKKLAANQQQALREANRAIRRQPKLPVKEGAPVVASTAEGLEVRSQRVRKAGQLFRHVELRDPEQGNRLVSQRLIRDNDQAVVDWANKESDKLKKRELVRNVGSYHDYTGRHVTIQEYREGTQKFFLVSSGGQPLSMHPTLQHARSRYPTTQPVAGTRGATVAYPRAGYGPMVTSIKMARPTGKKRPYTAVGPAVPQVSPLQLTSKQERQMTKIAKALSEKKWSMAKIDREIEKVSRDSGVPKQALVNWALVQEQQISSGAGKVTMPKQPYRAAVSQAARAATATTPHGRAQAQIKDYRRERSRLMRQIRATPDYQALSDADKKIYTRMIRTQSNEQLRVLLRNWQVTPPHLRPPPGGTQGPGTPTPTPAPATPQTPPVVAPTPSGGSTPAPSGDDMLVVKDRIKHMRQYGVIDDVEERKLSQNMHKLVGMSMDEMVEWLDQN